MAWPTKIDQIIDLINTHMMMYLARWYKSDAENEISIVLYGGYCASAEIDYVLSKVEITNYKWVIKVCNMWARLFADKRPIYRGDNMDPPKNTKVWDCIRGVEITLRFKISSVGTPQMWTENMRKVNVGSKPPDQ